MSQRTLLSLLVVIVTLSCQMHEASAQTQTPFQQETDHNTAACANGNHNPQPYCLDVSPTGFPFGTGPWVGGWRDNRANILTPVINPGVGDYGNAQGYFGNVSKGRGSPPWPDLANPGDIHNLLYPGNTTKVFAAIQHWFSTTPLSPLEAVICDPTLADGTCNNGIDQKVFVATSYGGHKVTGYSVNDSAYTDAMANDLWNRGFDGVIFNKLSASMLTHTLSLAKVGRGSVGASTAALVCGSRCSRRMALHGHGAQVTLTARALTGARFVGWSGACSGTAPTCTVTVDAARSVTATFR